MYPRIARCDVVEVSPQPTDGIDRQPPRDLLPWADPYIARLLIKHRVDCAIAGEADRFTSQREDARFRIDSSHVSDDASKTNNPRPGNDRGAW